MQAMNPLPRKLMFFDEIKCNIEIRLSRPVSTSQPRQLRPTMRAVNNDARIPRVSEIAKPFTGPVAFQNKIAAVISVVTFASKIELKLSYRAVLGVTLGDCRGAIIF